MKYFPIIAVLVAGACQTDTPPSHPSSESSSVESCSTDDAYCLEFRLEPHLTISSVALSRTAILSKPVDDITEEDAEFKCLDYDFLQGTGYFPKTYFLDSSEVSPELKFDSITTNAGSFVTQYKSYRYDLIHDFTLDYFTNLTFQDIPCAAPIRPNLGYVRFNDEGSNRTHLLQLRLDENGPHQPPGESDAINVICAEGNIACHVESGEEQLKAAYMVGKGKFQLNVKFVQ